MKNNFLKIFIFTILLIILFFPFKKIKAIEASLFFESDNKSFILGDTLSVNLKLDTGGSSINAVESVIYFSADELEFLDFSKEGSIFNFWPSEPELSDSLNRLSFSAGLPNPGFNGKGQIINIKFKLKKSGILTINLLESKVLANDGLGTNILTFIKEAKYSVQELQIEEKTKTSNDLLVFSPTHLNEQEWYNDNNPVFKWNLLPQINKLSFVLDQTQKTLPDDIPEELINEKEYENLEDGIWYFHIKFGDEDSWKEPFHYKIMIDSSPPDPFEVVVDNEGDTTNPNPKLYFETQDNLSGINYYNIKIGKRDFLKLMLAQINPFSLPKLVPGKYDILVRASDMAGNNVETQSMIAIDPIEIPKINIWPQKYIAGEEIFYLEGSSLPETEIIIYLKSNKEEIKKWQVLSNEKGDWFFSTEELIKTGRYYLQVQAQDERGAVSLISKPKEIEVSLSGLCIGSLMISFKNLILIILFLIFFSIILIIRFILKIKKMKKAIKKETLEAKEILHKNFDDLKKKIEKKIEMLDLKEGLSEKEKVLYEELKSYLEESENSIEKEVKDIEKEL